MNAVSTSLCSERRVIYRRVSGLRPSPSVIRQTRQSCLASRLTCFKTSFSLPASGFRPGSALSARFFSTTCLRICMTRSRLRCGGTTEMSESLNTSAPTRSPTLSTRQAASAATSAATTDFIRFVLPKNMLTRWSTSSQTVRSFSSV